MLRKLFFILLTGMMASCAIKEEISFNKDMSGTYTMTVEMKQLMESMKAFGGDAASQGLDMGKMDTISDKFNKIAGITGAQSIVDTKDHVYGVTYRFKDVETLNKAKKMDDVMSALGGGKDIGVSKSEKPFFEQKKKKLTLNLPEIPEVGKEAGDEMMTQVLDATTYTIVVKAEQGIKKVGGDGMNLSTDGKEANVKFTLGEFMNKDDKASKYTFKLK